MANKEILKFYKHAHRQHKQKKYLEESTPLERFYATKRRKITFSFLEKGSVLEIGCAEGYDTKKLKNVTALDISKNILKKNPAKKKLRADAHALPFKNKSFLNIYCTEVLEHLTNPEKALKEMQRVAENIVLSVPLKTKTFDPEKAKKEWGHISVLSQKELFTLVKKYFKIKEKRFYCLYFPKHWAVLNKIPKLLRIINKIENIQLSKFPWLNIVIKLKSRSN
jgi:ubiquinone/menaquinone biosynthesis C-methylase UbiE